MFHHWDRAAHLRNNEKWLSEARTRPNTRILPVWRSKNLIREDGSPLWLSVSEYPEVLEANDSIFLGLHEVDAVFAVDLSSMENPEGFNGRFQDLRNAGTFMLPDDFGPLAYARGMCRWHRVTKHCTECGGALTFAEAGFSRICAICKTVAFPRIDPAIMVLVTRGEQCLLARQPSFPQGMYSALAGFVEVGESLEQCVARETQEEVGLAVQDIRYVASQAWPFPQSLMLGFRAVSTEGPICLDDKELEQAHWFDREVLRKPKGFIYPPPISLAYRLIQEFIVEA